MKFLLPLSLLLCVGFQSLDAQLQIGLRAGAVHSWPDYGDDFEIPENAETSVTNFGAALDVYAPLGGGWFLSASPGYQQRGMACIPTIDAPPPFDPNTDSKWKISYVDLPLRVGKRWGLGNSPWEIRAAAGPSISYALSARARFTDWWGDQDWDIRNGETVHNWDYGISAGAGIGYRLPNWTLQLQADQYVGLRDVATFTDSKVRSLGLSLGVLRTW